MRNIKKILLSIVLAFLWNGLNASLDFTNLSSTIELKGGAKIVHTGLVGWNNKSCLRYAGYDLIETTGTLEYSETPTNYGNANNFVLSHAVGALTGAQSIGNGGLVLLDGIIGNASSRISLNAQKTFLASPINLGGGTLVLNGDLVCSSDTTVASNGVIEGRGYAIVLGGDLTIPANTALVITSSVIFDGQGHRLIFGDRGNIKLDNRVSVTFRNVILQNVADTANAALASISMAGGNISYLTLQNSDFNLSRNYSFTLGNLFIYDDVVLSGTNQFNYTSTNACFIKENSTLKLDTNVSFSYGPSVSTNRDLIMMQDKTSRIYLDGCTLKSTTTGLRLTNGTLIVDHKNYLYNAAGKPAGANVPATSVSEAISFGNGVSAQDLTLEILPGGNFELMSGILAYQNSN